MRKISEIHTQLLYITSGSGSTCSRDGFTTGLVGKPYTAVNLAENYAYNDQVTVFGCIDNRLNVQHENPMGSIALALAFMESAYFRAVSGRFESP